MSAHRLSLFEQAYKSELTIHKLISEKIEFPNELISTNKHLFINYIESLFFRINQEVCECESSENGDNTVEELVDILLYTCRLINELDEEYDVLSRVKDQIGNKSSIRFINFENCIKSNITIISRILNFKLHRPSITLVVNQSNLASSLADLAIIIITELENYIAMWHNDLTKSEFKSPATAISYKVDKVLSRLNGDETK